ncbi:transposase [Salmonella enterica]|nr:transposase [Salmonella enterica]EBE6451249.1 transposase [Salmonella enterica]EFS3459166.1 transposase [Salmonella enterica]EGN7050689.1 transposase [Salmonella enterica]EHY8289048.1 transposase [Salmonella enterica]
MTTQDGLLWQDARDWIFRSRRKAGHNADIWDLRFKWSQEQHRLFNLVTGGEYRLSPMNVIRNYAGEPVLQWSARDALVLKWVALKIKDRLPVQEACTHVAGRRGGRDSLAQISRAIREGARYVYRTDIRGYYRHIQKAQLYNHLCRFVDEPALRQLLHQYLYYSVEDGGEIHTPEQGICRGCSLSPLMGASFLWYVDSAFAGRDDIDYVRYMDDFLFLSDRRWPVRRAQKRLYDYFDLTGFDCHPDKTQAGKISRGFDWLGVCFTDNGATGIAPRAKENHRQRCLRLYEQARRAGLSDREAQERVQQYKRRWMIWAESQLSAANMNNQGILI